MAAFTITRLTGHTGAEVAGLDFTQPIDTESRAVLHRAFSEHHVLVIRDQHFRPDQFKAAAQVFGELQPHDKKERHVPGHPGVDYVSNDEFENGRRIIPGETFHTDHSNHPCRAESHHPVRSRYCRPAAATRNTSTCMTPMTTCRRTPSEESMG